MTLLFLLLACDRVVEWECRDTVTNDPYPAYSYSMTCDDYRSVGAQVLEPRWEDCRFVHPNCSCVLLNRPCQGRVND